MITKLAKWINDRLPWWICLGMGVAMIGVILGMQNHEVGTLGVGFWLDAGGLAFMIIMASVPSWLDPKNPDYKPVNIPPQRQPPNLYQMAVVLMLIPIGLCLFGLMMLSIVH